MRHGYFFTDYFLSSFRFTAKLREKYRDFQYSALPPTMYSLPHYQHPHQSGTFVITGEPTLTHHNHPKSIAYITVHSWCCIFYWFRLMYNSMYLSLSIIQSLFTALKTLCALPIYPSHPQPLAVTDLFTVSIVLPFPECHRLGIIQSVAFSDWLLSLSHMHLRFLRVFSWLNGSFLLNTE